MMKQLRKDLQAVSRELKKLHQKVEKMSKRLARLEKAQTQKKPRAKTAKKVVAKKIKKGSRSETVLGIIRKNRSKSGVDMITLKKKTGFDNKAILNAIFLLKKQGKIKSGGRGLYKKA
jgi:DNA repair exonuclease SbcCD ATPase subunit